MIMKKLLSAILFAIIQSCCAKWEFQLSVLDYNNPTSEAFFNSETALSCCDLEVPTSCTDHCDNVFNFTLSPVGCQSHNLLCSYAKYKTGVFSNDDDIHFNQTINGDDGHVFINPLVFKADVWPENSVVLLTVFVNDYDSFSLNDLVDIMVITIPVTATTEFTPTQHVVGYYGYGTISFSYRMTCDKNYYGTFCNETSNNNDGSNNDGSNNGGSNNGGSNNGGSKPSITGTTTESCVTTMATTVDATSSTEYNSTMIIIIIVLGVLSMLLIIVTIISCCIVILLCRKTRRKAVARRPLPNVPVTVSINHQMELYNCPAYEPVDCIDDEDEKMIN